MPIREQPKRAWVLLAQPGTYRSAIMHQANRENEMTALRTRVLLKVEPPTDVALMNASVMKVVCRLPRVTALDWSNVLQSFPQHLRGKYLRSLDRVMSGWRVDAFVSAFIKLEKICPASNSGDGVFGVVPAALPYVEGKKPRMIQARSPEFNLSIARFLRPIEKALYSTRCEYGWRAIAKGMNPAARARHLKKMWESFRKPVALSFDAAAFDAHVGVDALKALNRGYLRMIPDQEFAKLLKSRLKNKGRTPTGLRYLCPGGRMSGDMDTGSGNCLLMVSLLTCAQRKVAQKFLFLDDGDDFVVMCEKEAESAVTSCVEETAVKFGIELTKDKRSETLEGIQFCSATLLWTGSHYTLVPDPLKMLTTLMSVPIGSYKMENGVTARRQRFAMMAWATSVMYGDIPVLGPIAARAVAVSAFWQPKILRADPQTAIVRYLGGDLANGIRQHARRGLISRNCEVSCEARISFERVFGISVEQQLLMESSHNGMSKDWFDQVTAASPHWWSWTQKGKNISYEPTGTSGIALLQSLG